MSELSDVCGVAASYMTAHSLAPGRSVVQGQSSGVQGKILAFPLSSHGNVDMSYLFVVSSNMFF
jgi:hypothetical protein